jgi:hypothetical protein
VRACVRGTAEIRQLASDFNQMLNAIALRDQKLQQASDLLEQRVAERTKLMEWEIAERQATEGRLKESVESQYTTAHAHHSDDGARRNGRIHYETGSERIPQARNGARHHEQQIGS